MEIFILHMKRFVVNISAKDELRIQTGRHLQTLWQNKQQVSCFFKTQCIISLCLVIYILFESAVDIFSLHVIMCETTKLFTNLFISKRCSLIVLTVKGRLKLLTTSQVERLLLLWQQMDALNKVN